MASRPGVAPGRFVRDVDAGSFLESFLIAAVSAVLVIRVYLELTGYPQIGGGGLHIAHMLWGGVLMAAALILLLAYLGKSLQHVAAIVAGAGFGTFIDELGKFITSDNNYFFQPTIALIYATFIILFLCFRAIERRQELSTTEHLANAIALLQEAVLRPESGACQRGLALLARLDPNTPLVHDLRGLLQQGATTPTTEQRLAAAVAQRARAVYQRLVSFHWFHRVIVGAFLLHAAISVFAVLAIIIEDPQFTWFDPAMSFEDWGDTLSTILATGMVIIGVIRLHVARLSAYWWFKRSLLVTIFLVQFFAFYTEQLAAVVGVAADLLILAGLNYMIGQEQTAQAAQLSTESAGATSALPGAASAPALPEGQR